MVNDMEVNSREVSSRDVNSRVVSSRVGVGSGLAQGRVVVIGGRPGAVDRKGEMPGKSRAVGLAVLRRALRRKRRWMIFRPS